MARFVSFIGGVLLVFLPASALLLERPEIGTSIRSFAVAAGKVAVPDFQFKLSDISPDLSLSSVIESTRTSVAGISDEIKSLDDFSLTKSDFFAVLDSKGVEKVVTPAYVRSEVLRLTRAFGREAAKVDFDPSAGWLVELADGERVLLGKKDIESRLIRSLTMLTRLSGREDSTQRVVDARYIRGVAVSSLDSAVVASK